MRKLALYLALLLLAPFSCLAQQNSSTLPPNYKTILENSSFKIIRVHYGPHEKIPVHDHPDTPTVYVYLNHSSPVRISHEEEAKPFSIVRPPTQKGAFRVSPGRIERHSIENLGDLESDFLRVELLGVRLGDDTPEFRGPAPDDFSHNLSKTEFSSPRLSVARAICIDKTPCTTQASSSASVIIALSGTIVTLNGQKTTLALGDALSIPPLQSFQISSAGADTAHILQVLVNPAPSITH
jgi:quercetin dioxygenase-like cupin family protein